MYFIADPGQSFVLLYELLHSHYIYIKVTEKVSELRTHMLLFLAAYGMHFCPSLIVFALALNLA